MQESGGRRKDKNVGGWRFEAVTSQRLNDSKTERRTKNRREEKTRWILNSKDNSFPHARSLLSLELHPVK